MIVTGQLAEMETLEESFLTSCHLDTLQRWVFADRQPVAALGDTLRIKLELILTGVSARRHP